MLSEIASTVVGGVEALGNGLMRRGEGTHPRDRLTHARGGADHIVDAGLEIGASVFVVAGVELSHLHDPRDALGRSVPGLCGSVDIGCACVEDHHIRRVGADLSRHGLSGGHAQAGCAKRAGELRCDATPHRCRVRRPDVTWGYQLVDS
ncbi:hypothetical protein [Rhodococcus wratislaviensis]|uniref:hypothetical protein n=1 Tax=Rhodococcus wratislaviensis TaxID=44752 RepID=UPI000565D0FE|nr:hypothetical protein [Rhodococcus wratislaviensis]